MSEPQNIKQRNLFCLFLNQNRPLMWIHEGFQPLNLSLRTQDLLKMNTAHIDSGSDGSLDGGQERWLKLACLVWTVCSAVSSVLQMIYQGGGPPCQNVLSFTQNLAQTRWNLLEKCGRVFTISVQKSQVFGVSVNFLLASRCYASCWSSWCSKWRLVPWPKVPPPPTGKPEQVGFSCSHYGASSCVTDTRRPTPPPLIVIITLPYWTKEISVVI